MTGGTSHSPSSASGPSKDKPLADSPPIVIPSDPATSSSTSSSSNNKEHKERLLETAKPGTVPPPPTKERQRPRLRATKAAMTLVSINKRFHPLAKLDSTCDFMIQREN
jgi:hypothetical protein